MLIDGTEEYNMHREKLRADRIHEEWEKSGVTRYTVYERAKKSVVLADK